MKQTFRKASLCPLACGALALVSVWAFSLLLRIGRIEFLFLLSILTMLLWRLCRRHSANGCPTDRRLAVISLLPGLLFSAMMVLGSNVIRFETADLMQARTWLSILCGAPLFWAASAFWIRALPRAHSPHLKRTSNVLNRLNDRTFFALCWALLLLSWLPGLIASYPGVYGYDCPYQLRSYLNGAVTTHHPIIHTGWLALCVIELGGLLGSPEAGMCLYSISQMLLYAAVHASILSFLRRRGASGIALVCVLVLFMVLPTNAIFSFSGTKDVAFSAFVIWTLIAALEAALNPDLLAGKRFFLRFLLSAFGMVIFRNQGIYVFVLAMAVALAVMKGHRRRILALLASVVLLFGLYQGPLTRAAGVQEAHAPQEMLSVPIMQLSRVRQYYQGELSEQDKAAIDAYIPDWNHYSSLSCAISDPVKNTFDNVLFSSDPAAFVRLWARIGLRYPAAYIDAFLRLTAGYWYPEMPYRDWPAYQPYFQYEYLVVEDAPVLQRHTPRPLQWLHNWYMDLSLNEDDQKYPIISLLTDAALAAWILLLFAAWVVYERRWAMLWPAAVLLGLWGTVLLGPVVLMRYALPLIMAEPLLAGTMWAGSPPRQNPAAS